MLFKELFYKVTFEQTWGKFIDFYPELTEGYQLYKDIFHQLTLTDPAIKVNNMVIHIDEYEDEGDFRVHGKDSESEWDGFWDISIIRWDEWLSYLIESSVIDRFSFEEIVALCLYEMTWYGYDEDTIQNVRSDMGIK